MRGATRGRLKRNVPRGGLKRNKNGTIKRTRLKSAKVLGMSDST